MSDNNMDCSRQALMGIGDAAAATKTTETTTLDAVVLPPSSSSDNLREGTPLMGGRNELVEVSRGQQQQQQQQEGAAATATAAGAKGHRSEASRAQFDEAMAGLPNETKASYLEALRRAPHLVEAESNPDIYLAYDSYDPWKAALRVATYWKLRVEIFGSERAYLPMTLKGNGAMSPEDVKLFRTGFFMVLPNDRHGRAVMFHDRGRLTTSETMDGSRRLRCVFYALSAMAESESTRTNGIVAVSVFGKNTKRAALGDDFSARGLALFRSEAIPVRVVAGHLVIMENRPLLGAFASIVLGVAEKLQVLQGKIFVHNNGKPESGSLLHRLEEHGLDMEGIPTVPLGGLFSLGCFRAWVEDRIRHESKKYSGFSAGPPVVSSSTSSDADAAPTEEEVDEDEIQRKKKRSDAACCRRKRFKKRIEMEVTQAEAERLRLQNKRLREEGATLERYIHEASLLVERYELGGTVPNLPLNGIRAHRDLLPDDAYFSGSSDVRSAPSTDEARGPSESGIARATDEMTRPHLLHARYGGVYNRLPLVLQRQVDAPAPLHLSYAGMPFNLARLGYPITSTSQRTHALDAASFSDLVSYTLLQQQGYQNRLLAAASVASRNPFAPTVAVQTPAFAELLRQNRDHIDPFELALLELCGRLGDPPRLM